MKKTSFLLAVLFLSACSFEQPRTFSAQALTEPLITLDGSLISFEEVLQEHRGKKIVVNVWASWCKDCFVGLAEVKALQKEYPEAVYVFLSLDRSPQKWKRGLTRYTVQGAHYFMPNAKKGPLGEFLGLWWIPRYLVVDVDGTIQLFKAKKSWDPKIREALKK